ncbi:hypothetical protein RvY_05051 [Ramazzottius varieornatus]|uniref:Major facilitator superfamily (MFS) profile domain-containing protein n=1 Tax=Ramazzottius varieornatus TaxID=947166 RepID=A0A1D1UWU5_RAMVA|nr:hypothetical protein RvY_05051 [Ramazzottius varieornatus]
MAVTKSTDDQPSRPSEASRHADTVRWDAEKAMLSTPVETKLANDVPDLSFSSLHNLDPSLKEKLSAEHYFKEEPYGWVVVFAVFMISVIVDGLTYSFGELYPVFREKFGGHPVLTSMVLSILVGVTYGCGPVASWLCEKLGLRVVAVAGSIMAALGCLLSLAATEIWHIAICYGALTGLGFGFMYLSAIVSVSSWFEEHRALATSIAVCGSGVGTFIFAPITTFLLEYYGFYGCLFFMAAIVLNGAVFGMLLRPPPSRHHHQKTIKEKLLQSEMEAAHKRLRRWIRDEIDWELLTNGTFLLYCTSSFLGGVSCYVPYMYLSDRAVHETGMVRQHASFLISIVGIASIVGRLSAGILSNQKIADNLILYSLSCLVAGLATAFSVHAASYVAYAFYAAIFGFTGGVIIALQSVVLADIVGVDRISSAFGALLFVQGISVFVGPPLAGYLVLNAEDNGIQVEKYHLCFIVMGGVMCWSGLQILLIPLLRRMKVLSKYRLRRSSQA